MYTPEEREQWLESIYPNYKKQNWHENKVFHPAHLINKSFFVESSYYVDLINPQKICGLEYAYSYNHKIDCEIDWKYMLHYLKRLDWVIDTLKSKEEIVDHIHNTTGEKCVLKYGDHYFTIAGQHRLCLAKFLDICEVKVSIIEYKLDRLRFIRERTFERLRSKLIEYKILNINYENDSSSDYIHLDFKDKFIRLNKSFAVRVIKRYEKLILSPIKVRFIYLKGTVGIIECLENINEDKDLKSLDYELSKLIMRKWQNDNTHAGTSL